METTQVNLLYCEMMKTVAMPSTTLISQVNRTGACIDFRSSIVQDFKLSEEDLNHCPDVVPMLNFSGATLAQAAKFGVPTYIYHPHDGIASSSSKMSDAVSSQLEMKEFYEKKLKPGLVSLMEDQKQHKAEMSQQLVDEGGLVYTSQLIAMEQRFLARFDEQDRVNREQAKVNSEQASEHARVKCEQAKVNREQAIEHARVKREQARVNEELVEEIDRLKAAVNSPTHQLRLVSICRVKLLASLAIYHSNPLLTWSEAMNLESETNFASLDATLADYNVPKESWKTCCTIAFRFNEMKHGKLTKELVEESLQAVGEDGPGSADLAILAAAFESNSWFE